MNTKLQLSNGARQLFLDLAKDAGNWGGTPLFGGNVGGSQESKGFLTKLKTAGLVRTQEDKGSWVYFTTEGVKFALELGIELDD